MTPIAGSSNVEVWSGLNQPSGQRGNTLRARDAASSPRGEYLRRSLHAKMKASGSIHGASSTKPDSAVWTCARSAATGAPQMRSTSATWVTATMVSVAPDS